MDKASKHAHSMSSPEIISKKRRTDDAVDFSQTAPLPSIGHSGNVPSSSAGKRPLTSSNDADSSGLNRSK